MGSREGNKEWEREGREITGEQKIGRETEIHTQRKWWVFQGSWEVIKDKPG